MRKIWNKGHRIRASGKYLVYHFSIGTLLFVFVAVLLLLNSKQLMRTDWEHFSLLENGLTLSPYNFITIGIATGVCALVAFLYYRFCYDSFKKLLHRQKLARMVLENKWYEADTIQDSGFFTDLQSRSMIDCVNAFYEGMVQRSEEMKRHPNYKTGENYAYLGLPPCFLIFDEYVAFFEMLGTKESVSLLSQLKKIVMLGRQAGYFLIVACQRPDAKYFSDGIRDNFNFRVGLGRISELGYGMLFGSDVKKQFFQKRIKGRGYCDVGTSVISEFYTPLVPKGHDFLQTIGRLAQERQVMPEQQEKE